MTRQPRAAPVREKKYPVDSKKKLLDRGKQLGIFILGAIFGTIVGIFSQPIFLELLPQPHVVADVSLIALPRPELSFVPCYLYVVVVDPGPPGERLDSVFVTTEFSQPVVDYRTYAVSHREAVISWPPLDWTPSTGCKFKEPAEKLPPNVQETWTSVISPKLIVQASHMQSAVISSFLIEGTYQNKNSRSPTVRGDYEYSPFFRLLPSVKKDLKFTRDAMLKTIRIMPGKYPDVPNSGSPSSN